MKFNFQDYLNEAHDAIRAAELLLQNSLIHGCINRSYYSVFYCAQVLLLSEGIFVKTHKGLKTKFNELFILTRKVDSEVGKKYSRLFKERIAADYDIDSSLSVEDAKEALYFAKEFYEFTKAYFNR